MGAIWVPSQGHGESHCSQVKNLTSGTILPESCWTEGQSSCRRHCYLSEPEHTPTPTNPGKETNQEPCCSSWSPFLLPSSGSSNLSWASV